MNPKEFFETVAAMREAQKAYFRDRSREALNASKRLERKIDAEISRTRAIVEGIAEKEPKLF